MQFDDGKVREKKLEIKDEIAAIYRHYTYL